MTRYTVIWERAARDELAQLWLDSSFRNLIAASADKIDSRLAVDADSTGEVVHEGLRRLTIEPLTVLFSVYPQDCRVVVHAVHLNG